MISDLLTSIKTRLGTVLTGYQEGGFAIDIEKNSGQANQKRYSVLALGAQQVDGSVRGVTVDHTIELILTDIFIDAPMNDSLQQSVRATLQGLIIQAYKDMVNTKCGFHSSVLLVNELSISPPEGANNCVTQRATFVVRYRIQL